MEPPGGWATRTFHEISQARLVFFLWWRNFSTKKDATFLLWVVREDKTPVFESFFLRIRKIRTSDVFLSTGSQVTESSEIHPTARLLDGFLQFVIPRFALLSLKIKLLLQPKMKADDEWFSFSNGLFYRFQPLVSGRVKFLFGYDLHIFHVKKNTSNKNTSHHSDWRVESMFFFWQKTCLAPAITPTWNIQNNFEDGSQLGYVVSNFPPIRISPIYGSHRYRPI